MVLFDRSYWSGLIAWLGDTALERGAISTTDLAMFTVTDDPDEAVAQMLSNPAPAPPGTRSSRDAAVSGSRPGAGLDRRETMQPWSGSSR